MSVSNEEQLEFLLEFFRITSGDGAELHDCFHWRCDGEYAPVTIFAICNDLFVWGSADSEDVTPDNIHILKQSVDDIMPYYEKWATYKRSKAEGDDKEPPLIMLSIGVELFCARVAKMRPQGRCYQNYPPGIRELFDACGPDREVKLGNTARADFVPH
jgi:hypothetical protein